MRDHPPFASLRLAEKFFYVDARLLVVIVLFPLKAGPT